MESRVREPDVIIIRSRKSFLIEHSFKQKRAIWALIFLFFFILFFFFFFFFFFFYTKIFESQKSNTTTAIIAKSGSNDATISLRMSLRNCFCSFSSISRASLLASCAAAALAPEDDLFACFISFDASKQRKVGRLRIKFLFRCRASVTNPACHVDQPSGRLFRFALHFVFLSPLCDVLFVWCTVRTGGYRLWR